MPESLNIAIPAWLEWLIPRKSKKGWYDYRSSEPQFVANLLNVDRLRQIIASAETGNTRDLFGLYRDVILSDSHVQAELGKRKLAVLGDAVSIQPWDKKQPADVQAADFIKDQFADFVGFTVSCGHLLDGTLYPLALLEKVFKPSQRPGIRYDLGALNVVQANDLDFTTGFLQLRGLDQHTGSMTGQLEDADLAQAQLSPTDEALDTIGEQIGFSLQRVVTPTPPPMNPTGLPPQGFSSHLLPLSTAEQEGANRIHAMVDRLARGAAPDLSQAFRGSLAPIRRIILESGSAQECETRIREFYADWKPDRVTDLVEEALTAYIANGSVSQAATKR